MVGEVLITCSFCLLFIVLIVLMVFYVVYLSKVIRSIKRNMDKREIIRYEIPKKRSMGPMTDFLRSRGYRKSSYNEVETVWTRRPLFMPLYFKFWTKKNTLTLESWWVIRNPMFGVREMSPRAMFLFWDQIFIKRDLKGIKEIISQNGGKKKGQRSGKATRRPVEKHIKKEEIGFRSPFSKSELINGVRYEALWSIWFVPLLMGSITSFVSYLVFSNSEEGAPSTAMIVFLISFFTLFFIILPIVLTILLAPYIMSIQGNIWGLKRKSETIARITDNKLILQRGSIKNTIPLDLVKDVKPFLKVRKPDLFIQKVIEQTFLVYRRRKGMWYLPTSKMDRVLVVFLKRKVKFTNLRTLTERYYLPHRPKRTDMIYVDILPSQHEKFISTLLGEKDI